MSDVEREQYLFNPEILEKIDTRKYAVKHSLNISTSAGFKVRPLKTSDYGSGFLQVLSQLSFVGEVEQKKFLELFDKMKTFTNTYFVIVIEDIDKNEVVGTGMLVLEQRFVNECGLKGNIYEVVVKEEYRGKGFGKLIVATLVLLAEELHCYKVVLDCKDSNVPFYKMLGFTLEPANRKFMVQWLKKD